MKKSNTKQIEEAAVSMVRVTYRRGRHDLFVELVGDVSSGTELTVDCLFQRLVSELTDDERVILEEEITKRLNSGKSQETI